MNTVIDVMDLMLWNLCDFGISENVVALLVSKKMTKEMLLQMSIEEFNQFIGRTATAHYNKIQDAIVLGYDKGAEYVSIHTLYNYGVTASIIQQCKEKGYKFLHIYAATNKELEKELEFTYSTAKKLKEAIYKIENISDALLMANMVKEDFIQYSYLRRYIQNKMQKKLWEEGKTKRFILKQYLGREINDDIFSILLEEMIAEKKVVLEPDGIRAIEPEVVKQTIDYFLNSIVKEREKELMDLRLKGLTLEEVGNYFNVEKQRIQQIQAKILQTKPKLEEEEYLPIIDTYSINRQQFEELFMISDERVFELLKILSKPDKKHKNSFEELLDNILISETYSDQIRKNAIKFVERNSFFIDGEKIKKTKTEVIKYLIKIFANEACKFKNLHEVYDDFIENNVDDNLVEEWRLRTSHFENTVRDAENVLLGGKHTVRYYNRGDYEYTELFNAIGLEKYQNTILSALKFFREYPELMEFYDIRDEYELHNLLKKEYKENTNISFGRMPSIEFGTVNREEWVIGLLLELAPISLQEFVEYIHTEYAFLESTIKADLLKPIEKYLVDKCFKIDMPVLNEMQIYKLKNYFNEDFYSKDDVHNIFNGILGQADTLLINALNLDHLGFKVYPEYVISKKYGSAEEYFRTLFTEKDLVNTNEWGNKYKGYAVYYANLQHLRENYEVLEKSEGRYINIRRLEEFGISKKRLKEFSEKIKSLDLNSYFSIKTIKDLGIEDSLFELGFEDCFYNSLINNHKEVKAFRFNKTTIFKITYEKLTISKFLEDIIGTKRKIDIFDFNELLKEEYGVVVDISKLKWLISNSSLYYDEIMEKVYVDYEEYYEEI